MGSIRVMPNGSSILSNQMDLQHFHDEYELQSVKAKSFKIIHSQHMDTYVSHVKWGSNLGTTP